MSNHLAVAMTTHALTVAVHKAAASAVGAAAPTNTRPDAPHSDQTPSVNVFLYHVSPSPHWRAVDLPTRRANHTAVRRPMIGLDLHYLITFYGDDTKFEPQRMLGAVVRDLHAAPVLVPAHIQQMTEAGDPNFVDELKDANLHLQPELVRLTPAGLTLDELTRLWSLFPDTSYQLSVLYTASVVLVEPDDAPPAPGAKVLEAPRVVVAAGVPAIEAVEPPAVAFGPAAAVRLRVRDAGDPQKPDTVVVQFPAGDVAIPDVPGEAIDVTLPAGLRAGANWVRVVTTGGLGAGHTAQESNVATFVLNPRHAAPPAVQATPKGVTVKLEPLVGTGQNVALSLTPAAGGAPVLVPAPPPAAPTDTFTFAVPASASGEYLVRVKVDAGETPVTRDPVTNLPTGPKVTLPVNADTDWAARNQAYLAAEVRRVRAAVAGPPDAADPPAEWPPDLPPPALDQIAAAFGLSSFERAVLVLCAGVELDGGLAQLLAAGGSAHPTFGLALAVLPDAHWSALTPAAPLRRWQLLSLAGPSLTSAALRIDEQILHALAGTPHPNDRVAALADPVEPPDALAESHAAAARSASEAWAARPLPVVQFVGPHADDRRRVAASAAAARGWRLAAIPAAALPLHPAELDDLTRLCDREAVLRATAFLLDADGVDTADAGRMAAVARFADRVRGPVAVSDREPRLHGARAFRTIDVPPLPDAEQRGEWRRAFGDRAAHLDGVLDRVAGQFRLPAEAIRAVAAGVNGAPPAELAARAWRECRVRTRPRLGGLARRIEPTATWDDLVLPPAATAALRAMAGQARHRSLVYDQWGFGACGRGLAVTALFSGPSGTGKTTAAEVLAADLGLDLYVIDLSAVVSKYIGETEKNLRQVFDAAEHGGAVLQFDEADALFGRRTENVKDSHDRYANIEVSYLLQKMEEYRGLAVLTTNLKGGLDPAFMRRLRFVVPFPFPEAADRETIWRRMFPPAAPTDGLDFAALGKLHLTGGNIRSVALGAAFLAAEAGEPIRMRAVARAARAEYAKLERPLTEWEGRQWE